LLKVRLRPGVVNPDKGRRTTPITLEVKGPASARFKSESNSKDGNAGKDYSCGEKKRGDLHPEERKEKTEYKGKWRGRGPR